MSQPAVRIVGVGKQFGDHTALQGIDLVVADNEFVSLLGPSGCGKTTLLRIVSGFEHPTTGRVMIHGTDVTSMPPHRRPTNLVFQRGALFPHMNVAENIGYSLKLRRWSKARIANKVEEMLALVRLDGLGHRGPTELSGGQIQRAALARAVAAEPTVLLLDEPLSALDPNLRQEMQLELRTIHRELSTTFIYVTHDQTEALVMSDRIAIMNAGKIVQEGTPREIYTRPASVFASHFIGDTNLVRGNVVSAEDHCVTVATNDGTRIMAKGAVALTPGADVTVSFRPEAIRVSSGASRHDHDNAIGAVIAEVIYLGSRIRIGARIGDDVLLWSDLRDEEAHGFDVGQSVVLSWASTATSVWAAN